MKNEDLTYTGNKEDAEKLLIKQEKDTLYGNVRNLVFIIKFLVIYK